MKSAGRMSCFLAVLISCCQRNIASGSFTNSLNRRRFFGLIFPRIANSLTRTYRATNPDLKRKRNARFWIPQNVLPPRQSSISEDIEIDSTQMVGKEDLDEDETEMEIENENEQEEYDVESMIKIWDDGDLGNLNRKYGAVTVESTQRKIEVDTNLLQEQIEDILDIVGFRNYDVSVWITTDTTVKRLNTEYRNKPKSTDILSFPLQDASLPGCLSSPRHEAEMNLGEMIISAAYVSRACREDRRIWDRDFDHPNRYDPGISGALVKVFTVQERLPLLAIHGILHLLGYDHETWEDYEIMAQREAEVLQKYKEIQSKKVVNEAEPQDNLVIDEPDAALQNDEYDDTYEPEK